MNVFKNKSPVHHRGFMGLILFTVAAICILGYASASSKGALRGLKLSSTIIIPSIFPFTVFTVFFQKSGGLFWIGKYINKITVFLFGLTGTEFSVILISLLGGYPIGGKIINELYKSKSITFNTANKLLRFCINPSPAFFISFIGISILKNESAGWILLISNAASCIFLNLFFNSDKSKNMQPINKNTNQKVNISDAFVESVFAGAEIVINICAWVTLFSAVSEILKPLFVDLNLYYWICPFLEVSFGINEINKIIIPIYFYSFILSFGGISTICQVKQVTTNIQPSFSKILIYRIIHGITAALIALFLFKIFPISTEVFSNGIEVKFKEYPLFIPSVMLIIFSILFLMFLYPKNKAIDN